MEFHRKAPLLSLIRNASAFIKTTPNEHSTKKRYASALFVQRWREGGQGAALSEKLQRVNLGNGSCLSLSCTNSPWAFALEGFHFIFEKVLYWPMLITQGLGASEFSSQHQPVFCISSFQMDL